MISSFNRARDAWPLASASGSVLGAATEMKDEAVVERSDGGRVNERAMLKREMVAWSCSRTWRRVRRWGRAAGSEGWWLEEFSSAGGSVALGGDAASLIMGSGWSSPAGTNFDIDSCRSPLGDSVSARDTASPRRSSTSYAKRELVRRMSSVRLVRVAERREVWAFSVEMCDCVWEANAESD